MGIVRINAVAEEGWRSHNEEVFFEQSHHIDFSLTHGESSEISMQENVNVVE